MENLNELILQRYEKLERLKKKGIFPFAYQYSRTHSIESLYNEFEKLQKENKEVSLAGRLISIRKHGKATFAHIKDETQKIQIYIKKEIIGEKTYELLEDFDVGDIIGIKGIPFITHTEEKTINVLKLSLLTKSLHPLPEKWHGLKDKEIKYRQRYLDLIVNEKSKETFIIRSKVIKWIRNFLDKKGFLEVETPMMHSIPGGATAKPFKTFHEALNLNLFLRIAPELYLKRLIIGGFEKIYELNKSFRNEGMDKLHNPEYTMLELYQAYSDYNEMMDFTEEIIHLLVKEVFSNLKIGYENEFIDFSLPWKRMTLETAFKEYAGIDLNDKEEIEKLLKQLEEKGKKKDLLKLFESLCQTKIINPTFITDFPIENSPLSKGKKDNPKLAERFELFIGRIEVANAFSELNDPLEQRKRFQKQLIEKEEGIIEIDEDYIKALEYGMPPTGGVGIGIDRLVMLLTNSNSIRDVILFPQMRPL